MYRYFVFKFFFLYKWIKTEIREKKVFTTFWPSCDP